MQRASVKNLAVIGVGLFIVVGCASMPRTGGGGELPTCSGWSNCNRSPAHDPHPPVCTFTGRQPYFGPTVVSDLSDGVSSDGRGPYVQGTNGVGFSAVTEAFVGLALPPHQDSIKNPRTFTVNLNNPVPGGGGSALGIVTTGNNDTMLYTSWKRVGDFAQSLLDIPVGQTVTAAQMNVGVHINGHLHILQMGPQPLGVCHTSINRVNGAGTSSGTIHRASETKWVVDLPAGSVGRLFDLYNTTQYAVDKGLYYVHLHYEIGK